MDTNNDHLDACTEAYMNAHGMDVNDDTAWNRERLVVAELIRDGEWPA